MDEVGIDLTQPKEMPDHGARGENPEERPGWHPEGEGIPAIANPEEGEIHPSEDPPPPEFGEAEDSGNIQDSNPGWTP
jgi:hypothetical protein